MLCNLDFEFYYRKGSNIKRVTNRVQLRTQIDTKCLYLTVTDRDPRYELAAGCQEGKILPVMFLQFQCIFAAYAVTVLSYQIFQIINNFFYLQTCFLEFKNTKYFMII